MRTLRILELAEVMIDKLGGKKKINIEFIGKYDGEKLHEEIMSTDEVSHTAELDDFYIILPQISDLGIKNKFKNRHLARNPVIKSNDSVHMSKKEISKLLDDIEGKK
jgi:FlaA1/EpsC-like NDP-sugar epimerase